MIKFPNLSFKSKRQRNDFDSILPLTSKSSNGKQSSILGYIYDTSASIGSVIAESCQASLAYVSCVTGSIAKCGKPTSSFLPKTNQDTTTNTVKQSLRTFTLFESPKTPATTPIIAENEEKWTMPLSNSKSQINNYEIKIKTPSPSIFHSY